MADLITPADLARLLERSDRTSAPVVLDVRWSLTGPTGASQYRAGHLPGAAFVDLDRDLAGRPGRGGRHPLPDAAQFEATLRRLAVRDESSVVVYDRADSTSAARAWWLLRWAGLTSVQVLDGGFEGWRNAGLPVVTDAVLPAPGDVTVRPGAMPVLDADGAREYAESGVLLDARAAERYAGATEPVDPVAGHIPGARSAPTAGNVDEAGRFLPTDQLQARFAGLGANGRTPVGSYCGSGVTAAHEVLALRLAGVDAALYVGSWSEWVSDPERSVATGADPSGTA